MILHASKLVAANNQLDTRAMRPWPDFANAPSPGSDNSQLDLHRQLSYLRAWRGRWSSQILGWQTFPNLTPAFLRSLAERHPRIASETFRVFSVLLNAAKPVKTGTDWTEAVYEQAVACLVARDTNIEVRACAKACIGDLWVGATDVVRTRYRQEWEAIADLVPRPRAVKVITRVAREIPSALGDVQAKKRQSHGSDAVFLSLDYVQDHTVIRPHPPLFPQRPHHFLSRAVYTDSTSSRPIRFLTSTVSSNPLPPVFASSGLAQRHRSRPCCPNTIRVRNTVATPPKTALSSSALQRQRRHQQGSQLTRDRHPLN
uniref:CLASP N-terminal domain-containing protein n=1 Tax=Mycena chlorophos TaxID=658473 RepID=A0ABQ0LD28_MYCCL|nr:predicted protein [Mycena chlorophos]